MGLEARNVRRTGILVIALVGVACSPPTDQRSVHARPNIVLIVVDTLRADRLSSGAGADGIMPSVRRSLVQRGATFQRAYAAASWTLPSMAGLMTGRLPGRLLGPASGTAGIPESVPMLAQTLRRAGYVTAGFTANPVLYEGNGFARGFQIFHAPPRVLESMHAHADDDIQPRVLRWLRERPPEPFFLWIQYLDPHDPYWPPAAYRPDLPPEVAAAPLGGGDVHGLYTGELTLDDPRSLAKIEALYDAEVRYVDGKIAELLDALGPETLASTLVVFTSDHGEELDDHGGWKHGETLYDEQVRVPLVVRWDARVRAGIEVEEPVSLLDLTPTLTAAAGLPVDPAGDGTSLLEAMTDGTALPERTLVLQAMSGGPQRLAAVRGPRKLMLLDVLGPCAAEGAGKRYRCLHDRAVDRAGLRPARLYRLDRDPGEREDTASTHPAIVRELEEPLHEVLDSHLPGLRVAVSGFAPGASLRLGVELTSAPESVLPYFLAAGDEIHAKAGHVEVEMTAGSGLAGIRITGLAPGARLLDVTLEADQTAAGTAGLLVYPGGRDAVLPTPVSALRGAFPAGRGEAPVIRIWWPEVTVEGGAVDPEIARRLRAIGYVQ